MRRLAFLLLLAGASSNLVFAGTKSPSAAEVVKGWRGAAHAPGWDEPRTVSLSSISDEDGVPGRVQEWVTTAGDHRRVVSREFDQDDMVLTARSTLRRDWNGFVRAGPRSTAQRAGAGA